MPADYTEVYSEPYQPPKMELFANKPLTLLAKSTIFDVWPSVLRM